MTPPSLVAAVLFSAVLHASWNALIKRESRPSAATFGVLLVAATISISAALLLDHAAPVPSRGLVATLIAGVFEGTYFVALGRALRKGELGAVYAFGRGTALVLIWPASAWLLGESLDARSILGALVVIAGLVLCGNVLHSDRARPSAWVWGTAVSIAGYHLAYKMALTAGIPPRTLFGGALFVALPIHYFSEERASRPFLLSQFRTRALPLVAAGAICATSFLILLFALQDGGAGWVLTLRNTSVIFAQAFAALLGEKVSRERWIGVALIALGAAITGSS